MHRRIRIALVLTGLLAGPGTAAIAPPSLSAACGSTNSLRARARWLETSDHVRLYAIEAGNGKTTVVLAHQGRSNLCEELSYAKTLVATGLGVLAFDFRGNGHSELPARNPLALGRDLAAAVRRAHEAGAARVYLVGASLGGAAIVQNSGDLPVDGLVSLSGTRLWPGYGINKPGPGSLRAPFLYLGSSDDWRAPLQEARSIFRRVGSPDKRQVFYSGSLHAWQLVQDAPFAGRARAMILRWIRTHE
jgi:alpha-beta hydrolase superfamily lysophospholipase